MVEENTTCGTTTCLPTICSDDEGGSTVISNATLARERRKRKMATQRLSLPSSSSGTAAANDDDADAVPGRGTKDTLLSSGPTAVEGPRSKKRRSTSRSSTLSSSDSSIPPKIHNIKPILQKNPTNTKYKNRYVPEVGMTKEEESVWRREARKQRNRESAQASRNKIRNRITELEGNLEEYKAKYFALLDRISVLEKAQEQPGTSMSGTSPSQLTTQEQVSQEKVVSPYTSPHQRSRGSHHNNPFLSIPDSVQSQAQLAIPLLEQEQQTKCPTTTVATVAAATPIATSPSPSPSNTKEPQRHQQVLVESVVGRTMNQVEELDDIHHSSRQA